MTRFAILGRGRSAQWLYPVGVFAMVIAVWQGAVLFFHVPEYLLPAPFVAAKQFDLVLLGHAWTTFVEACLGFALANLLAFLTAAAFVYCPPLERSFFPFAIALKTTPLVAVAPLLVIWLGTGLWSKVAASVLICFFPTLVNSVKGLRSVELEALEFFATRGASSFETFLRLRLPSSLPYVISGLKISTSLAVVGAIVGEFVGASQGLGYVVLVSSYHMETPTMFAAVTCSAAIGLVMFWGVAALERRLIFWQKVDPS
jgi:NitT/TauT family transport system permease protein